VPTGFIPQQDQGYLIVYAQLPDAASLERTETVIRRATESMLKTPGLANTVGLIGWSVLTGTSQSNAGTIFAVLEPFEERRADPKRYADAIAKALGQSFAGIQDAYVAVFPPPPVRGMSSVGGFKMQVQDRANLGLQALQAATENLDRGRQPTTGAGRALHELPRQCAPVLSGSRPHQGEVHGGGARRHLRHLADLPRLALRQ
jgi:multidrug efflux pump